MAAGTNPPRVMQTMASKGPLSARRQANARASRWNWSQETGKDLRDVGWTMLDPNLAQVLAPRMNGSETWTSIIVLQVRIDVGRAHGHPQRDPCRFDTHLPKTHARRHAAQKGLPEEAGTADKERRSGAEGSTHDPSRPPLADCGARLRPGRPCRRHLGRRRTDAPEVHPRLAL